MRPQLILIDGFSLIYRQYYAFYKANFQNTKGIPTTALYGVIRMILELMAGQPDYIGVALDRGLSGREKIYPGYKAQRPDMPDDLRDQVSHIEDFFRLLNIPILELPDMEADDIIGTLARQAEDAGCDILIFTGDRDLLQLITPHITVQMPATGKEKYKFWDEDLFAASYGGLKPIQLVELKALMGDTSDNIPGVKGVGEKTAVELIKEFGDVQTVYQKMDQVKTSFRKKLEPQQEGAFLSLQLVAIKCDLPIQLDLESLSLSDFSVEAVEKFFDHYEFGETVRQILYETATKLGIEFTIPTKESKPSMAYPEKYTVVRNAQELESMLATFQPTPHVMVNILINSDTFALEGIILANPAEETVYIPLNTTGEAEAPQQMSLFNAPANLTAEGVLKALQPWLTDPAIPKLTYNGGDSWASVLLQGIEMTPLMGDFRVAKEIFGQYKDNLMTQLAQTYSPDSITYQLLFEALNLPDDPILLTVNQTLAALNVMPTMLSLLEGDSSKATSLYHEIELPLVRVLGEMEANGLEVDVPYLRELDGSFNEKLRTLEKSIYAVVGKEFLITSSKELSTILFDHLNYSPVGLTRSSKTGNYQLPADALEWLAEKYDDDLFYKLIEHRQLNKLYTSYIKPLPNLINPMTGRLHTHLDQFGAVTGRLSSRKPNLQNIPTRTSEGQEIRRAFIAPPGKLLLSADYSQIELRILAHISGDERLREAFLAGADIHQSVASRLFNVDVTGVTSEQRRMAKIVNFGVLYGMGSYRLTRETGMTLKDSGEFIKTFFRTFPEVQNYVETTKQFARENGYVSTLFGRRRHFPELLPAGIQKLRATDITRLEREAVNTPIQGTAADIIKLATLEVAQALHAGHPKAKILLQIHDELLLEVPQESVSAVSAVLAEHMNAVGATWLSVPLITSVRSGHNWADLTSV